MRPSVTATVMSGCTRRSSEPFGPLTRTVRSATATSTPRGIGMGSRPTRDMRDSSPDEAQDLAAHPRAPRVAVGHDAARRRENGDAETSAHPRDLGSAPVDAQAGPADPPQPGDDGRLARRTVAAVPQREAQLVRRFLVDFEVGDEPLVLENLRDLELHARRRYENRVVPRRHRVADARQHVCDRIGDHAHSVTSPAGLDHAGDLAFVREGAQTDPAEAELPEDRARTAAQPAAAVPPDLELGRLPPLQQQRLFRHASRSPGWCCAVRRARAGGAGPARFRALSPAGRSVPRRRPSGLIGGRRGPRALAVAGRIGPRRRPRGPIGRGGGRLRRRPLAERQPESPQELPRLFVGPRRRHDGDVHPADLVHFVVLDFREDQLLPDADVHAAAAVERPRGNPLEVLDPRQADVEQLVEELVHPLPAQRHLAPDRVAGPQLERRDRPPRARDHRPLAADRGEFFDRLVEVPLVLQRVGDAHVDDHLLDLRRLHDRAVAEPLPQRRQHVGLVAFPHSRHGYLSMTSPQWRHTRTLPPSSSTRCPYRTARPQRGQTSIAFPAGNAISFSTIPPDGIFSLGLVWRFATITASTMMRPRSGSTRSTLPRLPRYLPVITSTVSPRRTCTRAARPARDGIDAITAPPAQAR